MKSILFGLLTLSLSLSAQTIENVSFFQEGNHVVVYYDYVADEGVECDVALYYSVDGGKNFFPCGFTSGDVGRVTPYYSRRIQWQASKDLGRFYKENCVLRVQGTVHRQDITSANTQDYGDMVFVKGGTFKSLKFLSVGVPAPEITVSDFLMSKYEVTELEMRAYSLATRMSRQMSRHWSKSPLPAGEISWYDAIEYCNWRSKQEGLDTVYQVNKITFDPS
ncbi:MAG: SUMF1/EgtB/PvdO family nonheme iron enzyme, partial [Bacteroidota bacterium]